MATARVVGKNARMYVGDIALYLRAFEMENGIELNTVDATAYGVDWREFELVDGNAAMAINAFLSNRPVLDDAYATDAAYMESFQSTGGSVFKADPKIAVTHVPGNTAAQGDEAYFMDAIAGSLAISAPRNDLVRLRGAFQGAASMRQGLIIAQVEQSWPSGDTFIPAPTSGVDMGSLAAVTSSSVANPTVITTATPHFLKSGDNIRIAGHSGSTPDINGTHVATVLTATTFTIPVNVTVGGTGGIVLRSVGVAAAYHVYKKTAGATFTIEIQDSDSSGGTYAAALTFPTFTAVGNEYQEDTTDASKQFHRVRVNNAGAAETLGLIIVSTII